MAVLFDQNNTYSLYLFSDGRERRPNEENEIKVNSAS